MSLYDTKPMTVAEHLRSLAQSCEKWWPEGAKRYRAQADALESPSREAPEYGRQGANPTAGRSQEQEEADARQRKLSVYESLRARGMIGKGSFTGEMSLAAFMAQ